MGVFVATFAFGLALGAAWEIVEWAFDAFLETKLVPSAQDIALDLLADAVGSLGGGVLLVSWSVLGWSASRDGDPRLSEP